MILVTICTTERSFSTPKGIKIYLRATITIKPDEVVDMYANKHFGRILPL